MATLMCASSSCSYPADESSELCLKHRLDNMEVVFCDCCEEQFRRAAFFPCFTCRCFRDCPDCYPIEEEEHNASE